MRGCDGFRSSSSSSTASSPRAARAVVVDAGGVILADLPQGMLLTVARDRSLVPDPADADAVSRAHETNRAAWHRARIDPELDEDIYWDLLSAGNALAHVPRDVLRRALRDSFEAYGDVLALLRGVRARGTPVGILTNHASRWFAEIVERFALHEIAPADLIVVSADVRVAKPDPDVFRVMLARLGAHGIAELSPSDVVFVDDKPQNVAAARALGLRGVHFSRVHEPAAALAAALAAEGVPVPPPPPSWEKHTST